VGCEKCATNPTSLRCPPNPTPIRQVVDATMRGGPARFINHSCEPNCYTKVVTIDGVKHILFFAGKDIQEDAEITYDYKLPIEDVKIPCHCGASQCRGYLN